MNSVVYRKTTVRRGGGQPIRLFAMEASSLEIVQRTKNSRMTRNCADPDRLDTLRCMRMTGAAIAVVLAATVLLCPAAVTAQPANEFYKGRQLRIVVGSTTGGDY